MCGISGFCNLPNNWQENIKNMNERIIHRGPDGDGVWTNDDHSVVLGHRRLAVLDLSNNGYQPMSSNSGHTVIVFNGEIYNHLVLKKELVEAGFVKEFRGHSDTEVLLECIEAFGVEKTLKMAKGMFAFAVYDRRTETVFLARDRMGEKPLYYGFFQNGFIFSSDIAAITKHSAFEEEIDREALALFFRGGYIPAPYSIYKNVFKLDAGCFLEIKKPFREGRVAKYWDIMEVAKYGEDNPLECSEAELTDRLDNLLQAAIKEQLVADVPVGAFLSGGIDSTTVSAVMQSVSSAPIKTFCIGFKTANYNEAEHAKKIAEYLGTDHTELYITEREAMDIIPRIPYIYGEPFADDSELATVIVSQLARKEVTVSLSGDGGDELFGGYKSYNREEELWSKIEKLPLYVKSVGGRLLRSSYKKNNNKFHRYGHYLLANSIEELHEIHTAVAPMADCIVRDTGVPNYKYKTYPRGYMCDRKANIMLMDSMVYLPDNNLTKVDRASMAVSLESRVPLLDKDIVEFAWKVPMKYKNDGQTTKKILRNVLYRYVPQELVDRPKKGFAVPVGEWCRNGDLKDWSGDMLSPEKIKTEGFLDYKVVSMIQKDFEKSGENADMIWKLCMFENWLDERKK